MCFYMVFSLGLLYSKSESVVQSFEFHLFSEEWSIALSLFWKSSPKEIVWSLVCDIFYDPLDYKSTFNATLSQLFFWLWDKTISSYLKSFFFFEGFCEEALVELEISLKINSTKLLVATTFIGKIWVRNRLTMWSKRCDE